MAENNVMFEGILLKPSMVTPGAEAKDRATPEQVAEYTLKLLRRRIPPAVPGIMFLSGGQSEPENVKAAQDALLLRAKANSLAQLGKYTSDGEAAEAKEGMFVKNYSY
ncbi:hypothetical protein EJB05_53940, partial [Eragrostis curvula]